MPLPTQLTDDELQVVRDALAARPDWLTLARALEAEAISRESDGLRMLSVAFIYDLIDEPGSRRGHIGSPYASMFEGESGSFPPRPADVVPEVRAVWSAARGAIDDPVVVARISAPTF